MFFQPSVNKSVVTIDQRWADLRKTTPLHQLRLQFRLEELAFHTYLTELEKPLTAAADSGDSAAKTFIDHKIAGE